MSTPTARPPPADRQDNRWPVAVAALALVFLAGLGFSLYWGITRTSEVSDPAYYTRGRGYGERLRAEGAAGNWRLAVERRGTDLAVQLRDGADAPLSDLRGSLIVLAADGTDGPRWDLIPGTAPGEYLVPWPLLPPGGARAVVEVAGDGAVLRRSLLLTP